MAVQYLPIRDYYAFYKLLPNPRKWRNNQRLDLAKRNMALMLALGAFAFIALVHVVLAFLQAAAWARYNMLLDHYSLRPGQRDTDRTRNCFRMTCALICPSEASVPGWLTIQGLPYAFLPHYFAEAKAPYEFEECYLAFWRGVSVKKRSFYQGEFRFSGQMDYSDESECAQLKLSYDNEIPVGIPQTCLTVSFHYEKAQNQSVKINHPMLIYIGGEHLLSYRPRLISAKQATNLGMFYATINYRVGLFGFSDFNIDGSGPNHGIMDVRKGLQWLVQHSHMFGADKSRITLFGEKSGATIALALLTASSHNRSEGMDQLFHRLWLVDGSSHIKRVDELNNPFSNMILQDPDLERACTEWINLKAPEKADEPPSLAQRFECLQDVGVKSWLLKTPVDWLASSRTESSLPEPSEIHVPVIVQDQGVTGVSDPIQVARSYQSAKKKISIVLLSSMTPEISSYNKLAENVWSLEDLRQRINNAFAQFPETAGNGAWQIYEPVFVNYASIAHVLKRNVDFRLMFSFINHDIRQVCAYNILAKKLRYSGLIAMDQPIFRVLNRLRNEPYVDEAGAACHTPWILIDDTYSCGKGTHKLFPIPEEGLQSPDRLVGVLREFVHEGKIDSLAPIQAPTFYQTGTVELIYNAFTEMGAATIGTREAAMLTACQLWSSNDENVENVIRYGVLN